MYLVFTRMPGESYCGCISGGVYVPCIFTRMPGESYRRRLRSLLLYLCYVFRAPLCVDSTRAVWAAFRFRFVPNKVPVDLKHHEEEVVRVQELCEHSEFRSCVKVEVAVLSFPS